MAATTPVKQQRTFRAILTAMAVVTLVLFGAVEAEAIMRKNLVIEVLAGLGIIGQIIILWLRSR